MPQLSTTRTTRTVTLSEGRRLERTGDWIMEAHSGDDETVTVHLTASGEVNLSAATSTVAPTIAEVTITTDTDGISVTPVWTHPDGLDRPIVGGYGVKATDRRLAERLKAAMLAGAVYYDAEVRTDIYGQTYVSAPTRVLGRMMNADLRRLGF